MLWLFKYDTALNDNPFHRQIRKSDFSNVIFLELEDGSFKLYEDKRDYYGYGGVWSRYDVGGGIWRCRCGANSRPQRRKNPKYKNLGLLYFIPKTSDVGNQFVA